MDNAETYATLDTMHIKKNHNIETQKITWIQQINKKKNKNKNKQKNGRECN
jgi:hypothetical protein